MEKAHARAERIAHVLEGTYFQLTDEASIQRQIADTLKREGFEFCREVTLFPGSRIDFLAGSIGIEVKLRCSKSVMHRQITRYLESEKLDGLVLASATCTGFFPTINRKPVRFASLSRGAL